jgi:hypothetical protein
MTKYECKKTKIFKMQKAEKGQKEGCFSSTADTWLPGLYLTEKEKRIILRGEWLNDMTMDAVSTLLR